LLHRYSEVFRTLLMVADVTLIAGAWLAAYWLRFNTGIPAPLGIPEFRSYLLPIALIVPLWLVLFRSHGLYEPRRTESLLTEAWAITRATAAGVVLLIAVTFFARSYYYSRGVVAAFSVLSPLLVIGFRSGLRLGLRGLRRRGFNLRHVLVVGSGRLAEEVIGRIHAHPEAGLRVVGVLAEHVGPVYRKVAGVSVVSDYGGLKANIQRAPVDQVIVALPREESHHLEKILRDLDDEVPNVKLVPDLMDVLTLRSSVEQLDGMPIINLRDTPMLGWAAVQKRSMDLVLSSLALVVAAPLMALIGLAIWATSGRPIFYTQERMGLDGRVFRMSKFRSMSPDAETETGPVWARRGDARRTRLGALLRRFSLDELPQLWHVFRGDMSIVGPRPERPVFIEEFRREIPGYMLRHKVKAGLTGWAQIHGWRGSTSLEQRIEHDIYYIQNWSVGLDLRIIAQTVFSILFTRNAY
jgi:Undecaprenyl-phosphate glucose phosphotransferase